MHTSTASRRRTPRPAAARLRHWSARWALRFAGWWRASRRRANATRACARRPLRSPPTRTCCANASRPRARSMKRRTAASSTHRRSRRRRNPKTRAHRGPAGARWPVPPRRRSRRPGSAPKASRSPPARTRWATCTWSATSSARCTSSTPRSRRASQTFASTTATSRTPRSCERRRTAGRDRRARGHARAAAAASSIDAASTPVRQLRSGGLRSLAWPLCSPLIVGVASVPGGGECRARRARSSRPRSRPRCQHREGRMAEFPVETEQAVEREGTIARRSGRERRRPVEHVDLDPALAARIHSWRGRSAGRRSFPPARPPVRPGRPGPARSPDPPRFRRTRRARHTALRD